MKRSAIKRGKPLQRRTGLKRGGPLKRSSSLVRAGSTRKPGAAALLRTGRRRESKAENAARQRFHNEVCRPGLVCFFLDVTEAGDRRRPRHVCTPGDLDAHHLIEKWWIQLFFGDLPEDELLAIKYAVVIGCPLCRGAHEALPANLKPGDRIFYEELSPELIEFVRWVDRRYRKRGRPSMETRLEVECPRREALR